MVCAFSWRIFIPLFSNLPSISPTSPRATAPGFTAMSVFSFGSGCDDMFDAYWRVSLFLRAHFSFRGSLFSLRSLVLHLLEQKDFDVPSFMTRRIPVPRWTSLPQKWQRLGVYNSTCHRIFLASRSVSLRRR